MSDIQSPVHIQQAINEELGELLSTKRENAAAIHPGYVQLWDGLIDICSSGKRLRPYLVNVGYGGLDEHSKNVALAYELIHIAMLVHDDVIDQDDMRHGRNNLNGIYKRIYQSNGSDDHVRHTAHSASILGGDLLISLAYESIANSGLPLVKMQIANEQLSRAIYDTVGGQLMDIEAAFLPGHFDTLTVHRYKTAGYSFIYPLLTGAKLSGVHHSDEPHLETFALNLGIAYQLRDDHLGVFGSLKILGKSVTSDLRTGKQTKLIELFREMISPDEWLQYTDIFGNHEATEASLTTLRDAIQKSGAAERHLALINSYSQTALDALEKIKPSPRREALNELAHTLLKRDS